MNGENFATGLKHRAIHEFEEFGAIFLYLAFFFCALATHSMLLLKDFHVSYLAYGFAIFNALAIAKVILIGECAHLGRKHETKPLFYSAIHKAFLFFLLALGFHLVEEMIKQFVRGIGPGAALHEMHIARLLSQSIIVFLTFIPLFLFRELRRVIGEEKFLDLFFRTGAKPRTAAAPQT